MLCVFCSVYLLFCLIVVYFIIIIIIITIITIIIKTRIKNNLDRREKQIHDTQFKYGKRKKT